MKNTISAHTIEKIKGMHVSTYNIDTITRSAQVEIILTVKHLDDAGLKRYIYNTLTYNSDIANVASNVIALNWYGWELDRNNKVEASQKYFDAYNTICDAIFDHASDEFVCAFKHIID
jgi:hypothetical protein